MNIIKCKKKKYSIMEKEERRRTREEWYQVGIPPLGSLTDIVDACELLISMIYDNVSESILSTFICLTLPFSQVPLSLKLNHNRVYFFIFCYQFLWCGFLMNNLVESALDITVPFQSFSQKKGNYRHYLWRKMWPLHIGCRGRI